MTVFLRRLSLAVLMSFACIGALTLDAAAQQTQDLKARARESVTKGLTAQAAGRFDEAIGFYNQAYALLPHPLLLFNLGQAYRLKGDRVVALEYYRKYVAIEPNGRASKEAVEWTAQIERSMREEAAAAARKFEQERMAEEARKAERARKAEEAKRAEEARKSKRAEESLAAGAIEEGSSHAVPATEGDAPVSRDGPLSNARSAPFPSRMAAAGVALVGSLVSAALAYGNETQAQVLYDEYVERSKYISRTDPYVEDIRDQANQKRKYAVVFATAGVALVGTAAYLWFTRAPSRKKEPAARTTRTIPLLTSDMAGASILGDF